MSRVIAAKGYHIHQQIIIKKAMHTQFKPSEAYLFSSYQEVDMYHGNKYVVHANRDNLMVTYIKGYNGSFWENWDIIAVDSVPELHRVGVYAHAVGVW